MLLLRLKVPSYYKCPNQSILPQRRSPVFESFKKLVKELILTFYFAAVSIVKPDIEIKFE